MAKIKYPPPLTRIEDVLAPSYRPDHTPQHRLFPEPFIYLKIVKVKFCYTQKRFCFKLLGRNNQQLDAYFADDDVGRHLIFGEKMRLWQTLELRSYYVGFQDSQDSENKERCVLLRHFYSIPFGARPTPPSDSLALLAAASNRAPPPGPSSPVPSRAPSPILTIRSDPPAEAAATTTPRRPVTTPGTPPSTPPSTDQFEED